MWYVPENTELYGSTSGKNNSKWDIRETIGTSNGWLYYKVAISSKKRYNLSGVQ